MNHRSNVDGVGPSQPPPIRFWTRSRPPSSVSGPPPSLRHPFLDPLPASVYPFWTPSQPPSSVSGPPPSLRHPFLGPLPVSVIRFWTPSSSLPHPKTTDGGGCKSSRSIRKRLGWGRVLPRLPNTSDPTKDVGLEGTDGFEPLPHLRPVGVPLEKQFGQAGYPIRI